VLKVALTGGIATGKTYCLSKFARKGVPVIDADVLAHAVVRRGEPAWEGVRQRFGNDVLQPNGEIDRNRLGAIVFNDARARADLEGIVHPAVYQAVRQWYEDLSGDIPFALADIPLLYETRHEKEFDKVIVTWCPADMQVARLVTRDRLSEEDARRRLAAQLHVDEKARRGDFVIRTDGTFEDTNRQIEEIYRALADPNARPWAPAQLEKPEA
jgi:dephospho-CoA kinase